MIHKPAESTVPGDDYLELYKMLHEERVSLGEEARKLEMATISAVAALYANRGHVFTLLIGTSSHKARTLIPL